MIMFKLMISKSWSLVQISKEHSNLVILAVLLLDLLPYPNLTYLKRSSSCHWFNCSPFQYTIKKIHTYFFSFQTCNHFYSYFKNVWRIMKLFWLLCVFLVINFISMPTVITRIYPFINHHPVVNLLPDKPTYKQPVQKTLSASFYWIKYIVFLSISSSSNW